MQNRCFDFKKSHHNKSGDEVGYFNGSYSEIQVASYPDWTPAEILDRGRKMLDFMALRWNIDIEDWGVNKEALLFTGLETPA